MGDIVRFPKVVLQDTLFDEQNTQIPTKEEVMADTRKYEILAAIMDRAEELMDEIVAKGYIKEFEQGELG